MAKLDVSGKHAVENFWKFEFLSYFRSIDQNNKSFDMPKMFLKMRRCSLYQKVVSSIF